MLRQLSDETGELDRCRLRTRPHFVARGRLEELHDVVRPGHEAAPGLVRDVEQFGDRDERDRLGVVRDEIERACAAEFGEELFCRGGDCGPQLFCPAPGECSCDQRPETGVVGRFPLDEGQPPDEMTPGGVLLGGFGMIDVLIAEGLHDVPSQTPIPQQ